MSINTIANSTTELKGFTQEDFDVFQLQGLAERMAGIQEKSSLSSTPLASACASSFPCRQATKCFCT